MKIYQAGPLFSHAERMWHRMLKEELEKAGHEVVWPGDLINQGMVDEWGIDTPSMILKTDSEALAGCDAVVALLDGPQVDDGTAWEIGFAYAKGIPVYGIRTDFRNAGDSRFSMVNSMVEASLEQMAINVSDLLSMLV